MAAGPAEFVPSLWADAAKYGGRGMAIVRVRADRRRSGRRILAASTLIAATTVTMFASAPPAAADTTPPSTTLISVNTSGLGGDGDSGNGIPDLSVSADGRYVTFTSYADDLVAGDSNNTLDVFVRDRVAGTTSLVGTDDNGVQGSSYSYHGTISSDGRFVSFSTASALDGADTNNTIDTYVKDLVSGATELISTPATGLSFNSAPNVDISADGRYVLFRSDDPLFTNVSSGIPGLFVRDRQTQNTTRVDLSASGDPANSSQTFGASISPNGQYVGFASAANLDSAPTSCSSCLSVYVRDLVNGTTTRASVTSSGEPADGDAGGGAVSDLGDVAFWSRASNLDATPGQADIYVHDHGGGTTKVGTIESNQPSISANGRYVGFDSWSANGDPSDSNGREDSFIYDRVTTALQRVSVADDGSELANGGVNPDMSDDGRYVAFISYGTDALPAGSPPHFNVFLRDRTGAVTTPIGNDIPASPVDSTTGTTPVSLSFTNVTGDGETSLITTAGGPPPPSGFTLGSDVYYDIFTSAQFDGPVEVCISYDPSTPNAGSLQLFHFNVAQSLWEDITTSNVNGVICGSTTSFSPFALVLPTVTGTQVTITDPAAGGRKVQPGDTLRAGIAVSMKGKHPAATVGENSGNVTLHAVCPNKSVHDITIPIADQTVSIPANGSNWYPSASEGAAASYQGSLPAPDVCAGKAYQLAKGSTYSGRFTSTDTLDDLSVRFHFSAGPPGRWSPPARFVPS